MHFRPRRKGKPHEEMKFVHKKLTSLFYPSLLNLLAFPLSHFEDRKCCTNLNTRDLPESPLRSIKIQFILPIHNAYIINQE
jgi:hypothetical protein